MILPDCRWPVEPRCGRSGVVQLSIGMAEAKRSYVVDESGNRTAVMLPIDEYEGLLDELQGLAVIAQRRDEPTVPLDVVVEQLEEKWRRGESR